MKKTRDVTSILTRTHDAFMVLNEVLSTLDVMDPLYARVRKARNLTSEVHQTVVRENVLGDASQEGTLVRYRNAARGLFEDEGTLEIDDEAEVSIGEGGRDGAYVQAWVWVSSEDMNSENPSTCNACSVDGSTGIYADECKHKESK